jgi:hypothetical protein
VDATRRTRRTKRETRRTKRETRRTKRETRRTKRETRRRLRAGGPVPGQDAAAAAELEVDEPLPAELELEDDAELELLADSVLFEPSDEEVELAAASPGGTVLAPLRLSVR